LLRFLPLAGGLGTVTWSMPMGLMFALGFGRRGPPFSRAASSRCQALFAEALPSVLQLPHRGFELGLGKRIDIWRRRHDCMDSQHRRFDTSASFNHTLDLDFRRSYESRTAKSSEPWL
jgi:hypothetical protein